MVVHALRVEHPRHVDRGGPCEHTNTSPRQSVQLPVRNSNEKKLTALLVRSNGSGDVADAFQMPTVGVVRGFEVNAVLRGRHTNRVVPAAHSLVQPVQQVVSTALLVKRC